MIIKSKSRKTPSFSQLVEYMNKENKSDSRYDIFNNLYNKSKNWIIREFNENSELLDKRKNGVFLYHEIIAITRTKKLTTLEQKDKLRQVVLWYLQERAEYKLAYAVLHDDNENNLHYHIMISRNNIGETKRERLDKYEYEEIKKNLEIMVNEKFPELEQGVIINKRSNKKLSNKWAERKRRTWKLPQKDEVIRKLKLVFKAENKREFLQVLKQEKLEIYQRGKIPGVIDTDNNRKYRLNTLWLLEEYNFTKELIESEEKQQSNETEELKQPEQDNQAIEEERLKRQKQKKIDLMIIERNKMVNEHRENRAFKYENAIKTLIKVIANKTKNILLWVSKKLKSSNFIKIWR